MLFKRTDHNTPQMVADKFSVKELVEFERFRRDNGLWADMKTCYAKDSRVEVSWFKGSGEAFVEASSYSRQYAPHKLYNTLVWLNDNKAVAVTMATIQLRSDFDGHPVELQSDVKILYRVQKTKEIWGIVSMDCIYEKDALIPVYPGRDVTVPIDEILKYRPSYANLCYVLEKNGYEVNTELAGIDRPDTVNKMIKDAEDWLGLD